MKSRRVLAEQHLELTKSFNTRPAPSTLIGIVDTSCQANAIIKKCANVCTNMFEKAYGMPAPKVIHDGYLAASFTYIPAHIEYLIFELIKNSMRYTAEKHKSDLPPIRITVGLDSHNSQVVFRVSDLGGGVPKEVEETIFSWSHASKRNIDRLKHITELTGTMDDKANFAKHSGLGLPMSQCYAMYWGGQISLYSMNGLGSDFYVSFNIGNHQEQIE
jgi:signal transduction histidine kinase